MVGVEGRREEGVLHVSVRGSFAGMDEDRRSLRSGGVMGVRAVDGRRDRCGRPCVKPSSTMISPPLYVDLMQVGGAVKNVIAIAAGMCEGLGLGTNAMAALVTRGCNEMQRLALSMGARPSTLTGRQWGPREN